MAVGLGALRARLSRNSKKSRGQSLVEFTIMLPVLLIMLSGLVEFGFLLNTYLDVIDAARDAARVVANEDPRTGSPLEAPPEVNFWNTAWYYSRGFLFTGSDGRINWDTTDWSNCDPDIVKGDVIVSAFGIANDEVKIRYPAGYGKGAGNCSAPWGTSIYQSKFTDKDINAMLYPASIDNSGAVLVEIYYEYEMLLGLPWITAFVPDPIVLHAYTIMPNTFAEPKP